MDVRRVCNVPVYLYIITTSYIRDRPVMGSHHHHNHHHTATSGRSLIWALAITLSFAAVEAVGGWLSNSLALISDAGHMLTDASALGLAAFAAWLAAKPPSLRHSYGLVRAEVIAACLNSLSMLVVIFIIVGAALDRLWDPRPIDSATVMIIATLGLAINLAVAWILHRGEQALNTRAAMLHVMGDLLGSAAALTAGIWIYFTGWTAIDPILSLLICVLILLSSLRLLSEATHVIMEGVPRDLHLPDIGHAMAAVDGVNSVHDLHIWTLGSGTVALSAHVVVNDINDWQPTLARLRQLLHKRYAIEHTTIQPEPSTQRVPLPTDLLGTTAGEKRHPHQHGTPPPANR